MKAHLARLDRARRDDLVADENFAIAKIRELKARGEI
jgi:hypothetical protein